MPERRALALYDEKATPSSWSERMHPGEYAIHYSHTRKGAPLTCDVFPNLGAAETYAHERITLDPTLRCRIYDHDGFAKPPIREIAGVLYKGEGQLSHRFRRWLGSILFFGGIALVALDWMHDFEMSWPALIGSRLIVPGLILLFTEAMIVFYSRRKSIAPL
jgi:hypothetical protein